MDIKNEVTAEGMMDGMMDDMMDGHTPQSIIKMLAESERIEAALYTQIARAVPSPELCRMILRRARHELVEAEKLNMLLQLFGAMPAGPSYGTVPFSAGEEKEKK